MYSTVSYPKNHENLYLSYIYTIFNRIFINSYVPLTTLCFYFFLNFCFRFLCGLSLKPTCLWSQSSTLASTVCVSCSFKPTSLTSSSSSECCILWSSCFCYLVQVFSVYLVFWCVSLAGFYVRSVFQACENHFPSTAQIKRPFGYVMSVYAYTLVYIFQ